MDELEREKWNEDKKNKISILKRYAWEFGWASKSTCAVEDQPECKSFTGLLNLFDSRLNAKKKKMFFYVSASLPKANIIVSAGHTRSAAS